MTFLTGDRELEVRTATYGSGIDQSQHAKSVSHIIIIRNDRTFFYSFELFENASKVFLKFMISSNVDSLLCVHIPLKVPHFIFLSRCPARIDRTEVFFLPFMAQARNARTMKTRKEEKTRIRKLPYGPSKRG